MDVSNQTDVHRKASLGTVAGMSSELKERLKNIPISRCSICDTPRGNQNPIWKCFECDKKFCFNHLWSAQVNDKMNLTSEVRDVCDSCKELKKYHHV